MERRTYIKTLGVASAVLLTGCMGQGEGNTDGNGTGNGDGGTPSITDRQFEVTGTDSSETQNTAQISFEDEKLQVIVEGTIRGADACKSAQLDSATYDEESDTLTVDVETYTPESRQGSACAEVLTGVKYRATITFEKALPRQASVNHDGKGVASGARASASASAPES